MLNKLASKIAKQEGKKSQSKIGDVREILGIFSEVLASKDYKKIVQELRENGLRRIRRKAARKKGSRK